MPIARNHTALFSAVAILASAGAWTAIGSQQVRVSDDFDDDSPIMCGHPSGQKESKGKAACEGHGKREQQMSAEAIRAIAANALLIDCRDKYQFDACHLEGAVNIPLSQLNKESLSKARLGNESKQVALYADEASLKAAKQLCEAAAKDADKLGFDKLQCFASCPFSAAKALSQRLVCLNQSLSPEDASRKMISHESHRALQIAPDELEKLSAAGYTIFDVRSREERARFPISMKNTKRVTADDFVKLLARDNMVPGSKIIIADNSGEASFALHQHLIAANRSDFKFLRGGVEAFKLAGFSSDGSRALAEVPSP